MLARRPALTAIVALAVIGVVARGACGGGDGIEREESHRYRERTRIVEPDGRVSIMIQEGEYDARTMAMRRVYTVLRPSELIPALDEPHVLIVTPEATYARLQPGVGAPRAPGIVWERMRWPEEIRDAIRQVNRDASHWERLFEDPARMKELGSERIRGVMTTHTRTRLSPADLARFFGALTPGSDPSQLAARLPADIDVHAWTDAQDRVHRTRYRMRRDDALWIVTTNYFDHGGDISVQIPPESEVQDSDLFGDPPPGAPRAPA
jgi:hypothetical protein